MKPSSGTVPGPHLPAPLAYGFHGTPPSLSCQSPNPPRRLPSADRQQTPPQPLLCPRGLSSEGERGVWNRGPRATPPPPPPQTSVTLEALVSMSFPITPPPPSVAQRTAPLSNSTPQWMAPAIGRGGCALRYWRPPQGPLHTLPVFRARGRQTRGRGAQSPPSSVLWERGGGALCSPPPPPWGVPCARAVLRGGTHMQASPEGSVRHRARVPVRTVCALLLGGVRRRG